MTPSRLIISVHSSQQIKDVLSISRLSWENWFSNEGLIQMVTLQLIYTKWRIGRLICRISVMVDLGHVCTIQMQNYPNMYSVVSNLSQWSETFHSGRKPFKVVTNLSVHKHFIVFSLDNKCDASPCKHIGMQYVHWKCKFIEMWLEDPETFHSVNKSVTVVGNLSQCLETKSRNNRK